jgi:outer membrane protein assembly factor BamB
VTRRGAVFGCADGALLVTESGGAFRGEKIPYPRPDVERAREFHHRPGSATLVAIAGETGVWVLDVAERTWTLHETGPVVAVGTAGAGTPLLTLTADGALHALDPASGQELARSPLLTAPVAPGATIEVDTSRAYVNDPATGAIHEIDYGDALRVARTFDLGGAVTHMVETGR